MYGKYVDFTVTIKGKKDKPEDDTSNDDGKDKTQKMRLGGGAILKLSRKASSNSVLILKTTTNKSHFGLIIANIVII